MKKLLTKDCITPRKKYIYELHYPVEELWVMEVEAYSSKEALQLVKSGLAVQTCSIAGTTKGRKTIVVNKRPIASSQLKEEWDKLAKVFNMVK